MPKMTIEHVEACFCNLLSADERALYESRLAVANAVAWESGSWYAIGDKDDAPGLYDLYECWIDGDVAMLALEGDEFKPAWFVLWDGCNVVRQA